MNIKLIIARYNETLDWLKESPFNKYKAIVYNKGPNENFEKSNVEKIINLKNVGRESHTYFHHVINNYDNLADITIFLPGSLHIKHKKIKATRLIKLIEKYMLPVYLADVKVFNFKKIAYNLTVRTYNTNTQINRNINPSTIVTQANIFPYGKWCEDKFDKPIKYFSGSGIISASRENILKKTKEYYIKFYNELDNSLNPEEGFYNELSWSETFNLSNNIIKYSNLNYYTNVIPTTIYNIVFINKKKIIKFLFIINIIIIILIFKNNI
jgi:hypothetical protein